ncbi:12692_t:CDS:2 [Cetraspora pellucida]|uniref:12692_t:CDS:1 n=1 Tax=Cetraspora pellucida TaxID=1433469 RepID=A0ACA9L0Y1_9GLOM|nr:12692_t:CDS:2 [Cetraspora pellucida]
MSSQRKTGRKKKPIWQWFNKGEKINSSHYLAWCNFCHESCPGEPSKMTKHLLEKCKNIEQHECDNIRNILKASETKGSKKKDSIQNDEIEVETVLNTLDSPNSDLSNLNLSNSDLPTFTSDLSTSDLSISSLPISVLSIRDKTSINRQLLRAIISSNTPLSFVEDPEVIKLFNMLKPRYQLPSCKWISTDILDNVYENVQHGVQQFISDSKFLTLSGDGQILKIENCSNQRHTGDYIFAIYKEIRISLGDKWIAFISDSGPDFKKAQRLIREDPEIGNKVLTIPCMAHQTNLLVKKIVESSFFKPVIKKILIIINHFRNSNLALSKLRELVGNTTLKSQYPCITRWATFTKASETILQIQTSLKVIALMHLSYLISRIQENSIIINTINDNEFWTKLELFYELLKPYDYIIKILETENATLGQSLHHGHGSEKIFNPIYLITWFLHPYHHREELNPTWHLYIQETAYGLFCIFYPNYDQNKFIDEWLNYSNQEGPFSALSVKNPSFTRLPLRYWHIMHYVAPNLSEFACRLLSIPPNSATSEQVWSLLGNIHTERRNRLSPPRAAKMAQISWYMNQTSKKKTKKSSNDKMEDSISDDDNDHSVDEFMVNLNQISETLIDDIHVFDTNCEETIPKLVDVFDSKIVKKSLNQLYI